MRPAQNSPRAAVLLIVRLEVLLMASKVQHEPGPSDLSHSSPRARSGPAILTTGLL